MYSPLVTARKVEEANRAQGWELVYHTRAEIDEAIAYFDTFIDEETKAFTKKLSPREQRFISNERRLCALDYRYWLAHYAWIINWKKQPQQGVTPNIAQEIVLALWGDTEERGLAIMMLQLKARQLGMSTLSELAVAHRVQFCPYTAAAIASADPTKTTEMGKMIRDCWEHQPWWLMPDNPTDNPWKIQKGMPVEFPCIHTSILIQAGNQFHGVARGQTPNVFHLSELAEWPDASEDVDAALLKAIHETPDVFGIVESTGLGRQGWWFDEWELVKADYPVGRSRIRPIFLPWFVGVDIYPTPADLRARPVPVDWIPEDRTIRHAERARKYVLSNPLLFKHLAKGDQNWQMPREQMWYYQIERDAAVRKKDLNKFLREMPADDLEAFQSSSHSVIDQDVLLTYKERTHDPIGVYAITGPCIHPTLVPPRRLWDTSGKLPTVRIPVNAVCRSDEVYTLIPLQFEGYSTYDPQCKLFIYEWPTDGVQYGIGVDTSAGMGLDWSLLEGFRKGDLDHPHGQACEFASPYIKADQLWPMALALSAFYSTYQWKPNKRVQCRVAIECIGNGQVVQHQMKLRGWWNFHPWKHLDLKRRKPNALVAKEGVWTNVWFRSMMMDTMLTAIDEGVLDIGSPWFVEEMYTLVRDPDMVSARADYETHDDRIMAFGFILYSMTIDDRPRDQGYRRSIPQVLPDALDPHAEQQRSPYPRYRPDAQGLDLPQRVRVPLVTGARMMRGRFGSVPHPGMLPRRMR